MDYKINGKKKDPILKLETEATKENLFSTKEIQEKKADLKNKINKAWLKAYSAAPLKADLNTELQDIYKNHKVKTRLFLRIKKK